LGGRAADSVELFSGSPDKIVGVIAAGVRFSKDNPVYPIACKVADLKTRQIAKMSVIETKEYRELCS
jgi:Thiol-activated cytolysin